jgi:hypothetical protein
MDVAGMRSGWIVSTGVGEDQTTVGREGKVVGSAKLDAFDAGDQSSCPAAFSNQLNGGIDHFWRAPGTGGTSILAYIKCIIQTEDDTAGIAAWFIDTDYDEESFFVRHAYFLGANDPYKSLKTALQAEIDEDAWATLYSDISRPFARPESGRIAVKVINHFGDEVMKVFRV